jgi:hypothetical protein
MLQRLLHEVMLRASLAQGAGAGFALLGPRHTQLASRKSRGLRHRGSHQEPAAALVPDVIDRPTLDAVAVYLWARSARGAEVLARRNLHRPSSQDALGVVVFVNASERAICRGRS